MASIIRIKRSTGTATPASLYWGELAYVTGIGSYGGTFQYKDRIFIGDDSSSVYPVGGHYYTSMMEHAPGAIDGVTNTRNYDGGIVAILDNNRKVDQWNVDNLRLDLNTLSSTNTNGNIIIDPSGIGSVIIPDDTYLSFGDDKNVSMRYDELTDDRFEVEGADWFFADGVAIRVADVTDSTSISTGALVIDGGVGIAKSVNIGGNLSIAGVTTNQSTLFLNQLSVVGPSTFIGITTNQSTIFGTQLSVSGLSTFIGITTNRSTLFASQLSVAGLSTFVGVTTSQSTIFGSQLSVAGLSTFIGVTTNRSTLFASQLSVAGLSTFVGVTTSLSTVFLKQLNVAGLSTFIGITSIANTTDSTNKNNGALVVEGGVGIEKNLNVGGSLSVSGISTFDDIKIENNIISTLSTTNTLFIDPFPDGLSNEGTVIIKGNLQVDGTTTSINSTIADVNDPIIILGDVTTNRTVMTTVVAGVSTIRLDSVTGINTGDVVSGSSALSVSGVNTVTAYDTTNKIITLQSSIIAPGITTTTQLTITQAFDTNTDRGIGFNYNTSSGTANNKTGFFGYIDGSNVGSAATPRSWTYIPDATINNSVVSGTRGYLDIKGIYYQTGDFNTHGVVYFDVEGLQKSTNDPANSISVSKQILTAVTEVDLTLGSSVTISVGDIIKQDTSNAYGVVKTGGTVSVISLTAVEGTFTNTYNLIKEGADGSYVNLLEIPTTVTNIHINKPTWTATIDGGSY